MNNNPAPVLPDYETFHVTANKEGSSRIVNVLKNAGVRIHQTVWHEIVRPEYVVEVHRDDLAMAEEAFANDLGPARIFTNKE